MTFCLSGDSALQPRPLACFSSGLAVWPIRVLHGERSTNEDARRFGALQFVGPAELFFVVRQMAEFLGWLPGVTQKEVKPMCMPAALIPSSICLCVTLNNAF